MCVFLLTKGSCLLCCLCAPLSPMPEGSSEPLLCFPIKGRGWSDGWKRSKVEGCAKAAWCAEEEKESFGAVEVASLSCTTTGDRLIRWGSERRSGESEEGKSAGLFRILIGAKIERKKKTSTHEIHSHPKPILKGFRFQNKNKIKKKKGINK